MSPQEIIIPAECLDVRDDVIKAIDEYRRRSSAPYDGILGNLSDSIRDEDKMEFGEIRCRLLEKEKLSESLIKELINECETNPDSFSCRPEKIQNDIKFLAMLWRANKGTTVETAGDDGARNDDKGLTKLAKQKAAILKAINTKQFNSMAIPDGEKATIKRICELDYPELFKAETAFDRAWKVGINTLWRMENHESYAHRGK